MLNSGTREIRVLSSLIEKQIEKQTDIQRYFINRRGLLITGGGGRAWHSHRHQSGWLNRHLLLIGTSLKREIGKLRAKEWGSRNTRFELSNKKTNKNYRLTDRDTLLTGGVINHRYGFFLISRPRART